MSCGGPNSAGLSRARARVYSHHCWCSMNGISHPVLQCKLTRTLWCDNTHPYCVTSHLVVHNVWTHLLDPTLCKCGTRNFLLEQGSLIIMMQCEDDEVLPLLVSAGFFSWLTGNSRCEIVKDRWCTLFGLSGIVTETFFRVGPHQSYFLSTQTFQLTIP